MPRTKKHPFLSVNEYYQPTFADDDYEDNDTDFDPSDDLEFDEDGECISGDDTWDYPGSPYLSEDDDIY